MADKKNRKYIILIAIFVILFCICMAYAFTDFHSLYNDYRTRTIRYRMESLSLTEDMEGPSGILTELYFSDSYEPDFDSYWDFADIHIAYIQGRFADDKSRYTQIIQEYIDSNPIENRKEEAQKYLDKLLE